MNTEKIDQIMQAMPDQLTRIEIVLLIVSILRAYLPEFRLQMTVVAKVVEVLHTHHHAIEDTTSFLAAILGKAK